MCVYVVVATLHLMWMLLCDVFLVLVVFYWVYGGWFYKLLSGGLCVCRWWAGVGSRLQCHSGHICLMVFLGGGFVVHFGVLVCIGWFVW